MRVACIIIVIVVVVVAVIAVAACIGTTIILRIALRICVAVGATALSLLLGTPDRASAAVVAGSLALRPTKMRGALARRR